MKKVLVIIFLLVLFNINSTFASDTENIIKEQEGNLGISEFINSAKEYTKDNFEDIEIEDLYKNALTGKIDAGVLKKGTLKILGKEVRKTITSLGMILIIIIIHSIIKSISEGLGNTKIGEITYYVEYILIVTLIMTNFSETIVMIKETIHSLVGFINSLLPILLALMITTRKYHNCIYNSAASYFNNNFHWKLYNNISFTSYFSWNCTWDSF